ncbi:hypothetical protein [uncultured Mucilaginibacter sp.]|uniref:hypothetical protein n=1 Tax=uncultured Mucilaginibacter sp. TaxID=797541 RepID=UPI00262DCE27|nr:hypothetical protein [uncultured Mucilaginibacter sp.]
MKNQKDGTFLATLITCFEAGAAYIPSGALRNFISISTPPLCWVLVVFAKSIIHNIESKRGIRTYEGMIHDLENERQNCNFDLRLRDIESELGKLRSDLQEIRKAAIKIVIF